MSIKRSGPLVSVSTNTGKYYYSRLADEQKKIYIALQSGIQSCSKHIKLPVRPANELSLIYRAVLADNPMFFYATEFQWQTDTYGKTNLVLPNYEYSQADIITCTNAVYDHLRVYDTVKGKSDREKEKFVHDYCLSNFVYGSMGSTSHNVLVSSSFDSRKYSPTLHCLWFLFRNIELML